MICILVAGWLARKNLRLREGLLEQLNEQAVRSVGIFDSAMDAIITFNPSGSVENLNKAAERMFGYRPDELIRRDSSLLMDLAPGEGLFLDRLGLDSELGSGAREFTARRKDGATFPAEAALGAMRLPDGVHVVAAIRDISERKQNERLKDDFVSSVSHELRTPLTAIAGALGLLQAGAAGPLPEKSQRLVTIAKTSCDRLVRLINDLLDIQKMAAGRVRLDMRSLNMVSVVDRAVEAMEAFAGERKVSIKLLAPDIRLPVIGDADRLIQVMTNLLSNAIKHSPEGAAVDVTLAVEDSQVTVCVRDRGPGVPETFQAALFSRFAQAEGPSSRNSGGSGLGLAISREIAERHRGRLRLHESSGEGAAFKLELPLAATATAPAVAARIRLLLCEDDPDIAEVLAISLERDGFQVVRVGTLAEAETTIRAGGIDVVLLDLHLPDGHGLTLARRLRDDPAFRDLPMIVVTADTMANLSGLTFADWITKPVDLARLRQSVIAALHGRPDLRILHVDDDVELTEVVKTALADCGRVEAAHSLAEARAAIERRAPDLIILDIGLPDGSGLDLLPILARDGPAPPVIIYSGQEVEADIIGGVEAVLTKSRVSFEALAQTVKGLARRPEETV